MISHIEIRDLAIIKEISADFFPGLNIITGETGAGKSVVIEALSMALGARADTDYIRRGADKAVITIVADAEGSSVSAVLDEIGAPDEEPLIIRREISAGGRSLCRVNGTVVPLSALGKLCRCIADIHGQYDNQTLLDPSNHLEILDRFAGEELLRVRGMVKDAYEKYSAKSAELMRLKKTVTDSARQRDLYAFEVNEIDSAGLTPGEDEELSEKIKLMQNSETVYNALSEAFSELSSGDSDALSALGRCVRELSSVSDLSADLSGIYERISSAYYELEDASSEVRSLRDRSEFSPEELDEAVERMELINSLKRKYGGTVEDILEYRDKAAGALSDIENSDEKQKELERAILLSREEYDTAAARLSKLRKDAASVLEQRVVTELEELNFSGAAFSVRFDQASVSALGNDRAEFLISANRGEDLKPLAKVASGGEISRIMLALKSITADIDSVPAMIFDEIDSGISGRTAGVVAEKLRAIAKDHQIICITHLPQIAAKGDHQFRIEKHYDGESTLTTLVPLSEDERTEEIARLLSASEITDAARSAARELLGK